MTVFTGLQPNEELTGAARLYGADSGDQGSEIKRDVSQHFRPQQTHISLWLTLGAKTRRNYL